MKALLDKLLIRALDHRGWVLLIFIIYAIVCLYGYTQLTIDKRVNVMSDKELKEAIVNTQTTDRMMYDNTSILLLEHDNLFTQPAINALYQLQLRLETSPLVKRIDSLFNVVNFRYKNDMINVHPAIDKVPTNAEEMQEAKEDSLYNPFFITNFISADSNTTAIYVTGSGRTKDGKYDLYGAELDNLLNEQLAKLKPEFKSAFHIGGPRINDEITKLITDDLAKISPIAMAVLILMIMLLFRIRGSVLIPIGSALLIIYLTFGTMGLIGLPINVLNSVLPTLIIVISCAAGIHVFSAYLHGISDKLDRRTAIDAMLTRVGFPVVVAELTTLIGFSATTFSQVIMIRNFGLSAMIGIFITALVMLFFFPMMLYYFGPKTTKLSFSRIESGKRSWIRGLAKIISAIITRHKTAIIVVSVAISLACIFFSTKIQINNNLRSYFSSDTQLVKDVLKVDKFFPGTENFNIDLLSNKEGAFTDPKYLKILTDIEDYVKNKSHFASTISIADQLKLINQEMHDGNPEYYRIPATQSLVQQYYLFYTRQDLKPFVSNDFSQAYIIVRHSIPHSGKLNAEVKKFEEYAAAQNWPVKVRVTGAFLKMQQIAISLVKHQLVGIPLVFLAIFIVMALAFSSIRTGLLSLIPNIFPVLVVFGFMGLTGIPLNPGTVIVAFIAIGVGIDDTAHFFSIYKYHAHRTDNTHDAVKETLTHELLPVTTTSLALSAGFLILSFSNFQMIADFGIVSMVAILSALLADLIITPTVLAKIKTG